MTAYESRAAAAEDLKIDIVEMQMNGKGYFYDGCIFIRSDLSDAEKNCILAEEIAHYLYTAGDITNQNDISKRKLEFYARRKAYEAAVPFEQIVSLLRAGEQICDIAEIYDFTEEFLRDALNWYISKYGCGK